MDLLVIIVVGGVVGWLASQITGQEKQMAIVGDTMVGSLGALFGHLAVTPLGLRTRGPLVAYVVSLIGAVLLVVLLRAIGAFRRRTPTP